MNRVIKFRAWHEVNKEMVYFDSKKVANDIYQANAIHTLMSEQSKYLNQFTGLTDKDRKELFEGDLVNICFTSQSGVYIHDSIYEVRISPLQGLCFYFKKLLWESGGYNQYPMNMELRYDNKLTSIISDEGINYLCVTDEYMVQVSNENTYPFNNEKQLAFHSRYIEVIGNIYENPELLE